MPISTGTVSLLDIQNEFGGNNPIGLNEYYNAFVGAPSFGEISINNFRGKTFFPIGVETNYSSYGFPRGVGDTSYEWLAGASGSNLTKSGGLTFNNLGSDNYSNRPNFINYQNLILQAKPGDTIEIKIRNSVINDINELNEINTLYLNLGNGYFIVSSIKADGPRIDTINYTIPSNQSLGNYAIAICNDYWWFPSTYSSGNFYSLHIC